MKKNSRDDCGIEKLIKRYKKAFRIPENLNHYSQEDYKTAERRFIKHACLNGCIISTDSEVDLALNRTA